MALEHTSTQEQSLRNTSSDDKRIRVIADLYALPHWVTFRCERQPDGKLKKVPYTPGTSCLAKINKPMTWRSYAKARADVEARGRFTGTDPGYAEGVALTPEMQLTFIDIDGQTDHPLIEKLTSYSERSISKDGIHVLCEGRPPTGFTVPPGVEVYPRDGNRFAILTGDVIAGRDTIHDRTELLAEVFPPRPIPIRTDVVSEHTDDQTIIERVMRMMKGSRLYRDGDCSPYGGDHSDADLGLLNAFIAAGATDPDQLDRLFRTSALYREKWERHDYRERTLARALDGQIVPFPGWRMEENPVVADACSVRIAELERQLTEAQTTIARQSATIDALRSVQSSSTRILGNRSLGPPRVIAAMLATQFAWRATADIPPGEISDPPPPGMMRLSVAEAAQLAGVSLKSAGTHFATLAEQGIVRRKIETRFVSVDPDSGEILPTPAFRSVHFIGPAGETELTPKVAITFAAKVASFTTERIERRGGKRVPRCPDHPEAGVLRETIDRCAECRREVHDRDEAPLPNVALEPLNPERSANFTDHTRGVDIVLMREKSADHSGMDAERSADFGNHSRRAAAAADLATREPAWMHDAPDPWDHTHPAPIFPDLEPPRRSHHAENGGAGNDQWTR